MSCVSWLERAVDVDKDRQRWESAVEGRFGLMMDLIFKYDCGGAWMDTKLTLSNAVVNAESAVMLGRIFWREGQLSLCVYVIPKVFLHGLNGLMNPL